jgi:hypothetical protein
MGLLMVRALVYVGVDGSAWWDVFSLDPQPVAMLWKFDAGHAIKALRPEMLCPVGENSAAVVPPVMCAGVGHSLRLARVGAAARYC